MIGYAAVRESMPAYIFLDMLMHDAPQWISDAVCQNATEVDFIHSKDNQETALEYCKSCPVAEQCRVLAEDSTLSGMRGVWGGRVIETTRKGGAR